LFRSALWGLARLCLLCPLLRLGLEDREAWLLLSFRLGLRKLARFIYDELPGCGNP